MLEHLTQQQFKDYCRQHLRVAELLKVSQHLGECEACRRRLDGDINGDAAFFGLRSEVFGDAAEIASPHAVPAHLTAELTSDYVDKNLLGEELQMVSDHLTNCEYCALAVNDLRSFRNEIAPSLEHEYRPATVSSPAEVWWRRTVSSLPAFFKVSPAPVFGTALAVLLLAVTGWLVWRAQREDARPEVVVAPSPSSQPTQIAPSQPTPVPSQPEPALVAQLNDGGGLVSLDQDGKLSGADNLPGAYQNLLKKTLTTQRVEKSSQLNGLTRPPSSLMSSDKQKEEFSVIDPVGNVLMTDRPTFRWSPREGATSYLVEVYDDQFKLVATSLQITNRSWVVPQPLSRGRVYSWQVKAIKEGEEVTSPRPPAPQAKFRILDQAKANELARARRAYRSSHLTLGLLYAEAGLLTESEQELRALQKANPNSELVRSLLRQVQTLRRRSE